MPSGCSINKSSNSQARRTKNQTLALDGVGLTLAEGGAGRFSARLETLPAALADSGEWALSAVAEQPLTVQITDVRVAYETG